MGLVALGFGVAALIAGLLPFLPTDDTWSYFPFGRGLIVPIAVVPVSIGGLVVGIVALCIRSRRTVWAAVAVAWNLAVLFLVPRMYEPDLPGLPVLALFGILSFLPWGVAFLLIPLVILRTVERRVDRTHETLDGEDDCGSEGSDPAGRAPPAGVHSG